ncbi:MAG: hypothetical protein IPL45_00075 [Actinomycetales bacterium]|nr:hypothetical protein [Actinomycetales bacterium]
MESPLFVDVTDGGGDLLLAVTQLYAAQSPPSVATLALDSRVARLTRRRLRVHDLHRLDVQLQESGEFAIPPAADEVVHVVQFPSAGRPAMTDLDVLRAVDELVLQMDDHQRAVVLGPASALTDQPGSRETDLGRDAILRTDRLRAVVRLPTGLLVRSPRQALALWVFGPVHPEVPLADRWTAIADLTDITVIGPVIDDLVTDIVGAMTADHRSLTAGGSNGVLMDDADQVRGHQFRYARRVLTTGILAGRKALVDKPTSRRAEASATEAGAAVAALAQSLAPAPIAALRVEATTPRNTTSASGRTLADAVAARHCRIAAGNRLHPADVRHGAEGRVVIGPSELLGENRLGERRIDLLTFADTYPSGRFTEPGDVIFCTTPRIGVRVDHDGGSVVMAPAKVLRITPTGDETLLPEIVTADIATHANRASRSKDWRRWLVRDVPRGQREHLAAVLAEIERERQDALERLARIDALEATLPRWRPGRVNRHLGSTRTTTTNPTLHNRRVSSSDMPGREAMLTCHPGRSSRRPRRRR